MELKYSPIEISSIIKSHKTRLLFLALTLVLLALIDNLSIFEKHTKDKDMENLNKDKSKYIESKDSPPKHGIDISHYQGNLMNELDDREDLFFVICKATQGEYYVDPDFKENWRKIKQKGYKRGAYHFYDARFDPKAQANHFRSQVTDLLENDFSPIVDVERASLNHEKSVENLQSDLKIFLDEIEKAYSRKPIIYSSYYFAEEYLNKAWLADYPLWIADYRKGEQPRIPTVWQSKGYKIWQKSSYYHIDSQLTDFDLLREQNDGP